MKKIVGIFLLLSVTVAFVAKADSSPIDHVQKFQFEKQEVNPFAGITVKDLTAVIPAAIVVIEPAYTTKHNDQVFVSQVLDMPSKPLSRCNEPPAGLCT